MLSYMRKLDSIKCLVAGLLGMASAAGCSERGQVMLEYTSQPDHPEVLASATASSSIRVCVAKVDVNWRAEDGASTRYASQSTRTWRYSDFTGRSSQGTLQANMASEASSDRDGQLWANVVRSQIGALLAEQAEAANMSVMLVDRDRLKTYLDEQDLQMADIVQGDRLSEKARLLPVDLFIFGTIEGQTCVRTKLETNPGLTLASFAPYGGSIARALNHPKRRVQRTITFSGSLAVHQTATGRILLSHAIAGQTIEDERALPWQSDRTEMDLMPEAQLIRAKLDGEVRRFVGRLLPTTIETIYTVKSSSDENSRKGVRCLEKGANEEALALFQAALVKDAGDHRSAFGAGVACERLGRRADAEAYYRRAVMHGSGKKDKKGDGESQYLPALQRVKQDPARGAPEDSRASRDSMVRGR